MRFAALTTVFGLVATVFGQDASFDPVYSPNAYQEVPVGQPFTIIWSAQPEASFNDRISIGLIGGPQQNTQVPLYTVIAETNNAAGQFVWTPQASEFGKNFYGLVITNLDKPGQFQYSNPFKLVPGSNTEPEPTTAAATTDAATTAPATTAPATTAHAEGESTKTVPAAPVSETTSAAVVAPVVTAPAGTAAAKPTHVYNNGTAPFTTVSQGAPGSSATGGATTGNLPTGGAVGQTVSLALVGAGALFALAF